MFEFDLKYVQHWHFLLFLFRVLSRLVHVIIRLSNTPSHDINENESNKISLHYLNQPYHKHIVSYFLSLDGIWLGDAS